MKVVWLARARTERHNAIAHIAAESPNAALGQLSEVLKQTSMLLDFPEIGRPGRKRGTRELVITGTPFLAIYRLKAKSDTVEIVRFLHGAQRWPPRPAKR